MELYTPQDTEQMTKKMRIEKGGICGQACLAVIEKSSIKCVLDNWKSMGLEFKGWSGWKQLREYLEKRNYQVKLKRMSNLGTFNYNYFYILRVQWLGEGTKKEKPFYGYGHWAEASANTHFIIVHQGNIFCNEAGGWFDDLDYYVRENNAVITSAMEIKSKRSSNK